MRPPGPPTGKSFRLVRACVRAVCMSSEIGVKFSGPPLSLFPFGGTMFSLFPFLALCFPFSLERTLFIQPRTKHQLLTPKRNFLTG